MARGTDRLKRLERARSELEPDAPPSYTASPSAPATPEKAAPLETAEHFPPSFPPSIPRTETPALRRAQREADALAGETEDDPPMGALPSFTLPSPSDVAHGPALPEGDPMELLQQMFQAGAGQAAQGPMTNPLLAALQSATKQKDPAEQTRLANVALAQKELLRRAKPFRIVGILFSVLLALFALYLLATSSNVVDLAGLDENGDMQNADYAGWKSGARRIARLRFGAKEVLEDLGSEAVGYVSGLRRKCMRGLGS